MEDGQFSLRHRNVIRGDVRVTEARLTAEELRTNFTSCRVGYDSDPADTNGRGGGSSDETGDSGETDHGEELEWLYDEGLSEMGDKDDPNEDGGYVKPLCAPDAAAIATNWNSKELEGNKTHLWDHVMNDTQSAIKAMCVLTLEVPKGGNIIATRSMWLQGTINITDIFEQECEFFNKTHANKTKREEACYNLKQNGHVARGGTAKTGFTSTNSRISQAFVHNLIRHGCPNCASPYNALLNKMADTIDCTNGISWDTLEDGSVAPHPETTCDEKKTAVEWLAFRFHTALDYMKKQLHGALAGVKAAERSFSGVATALNDKKAPLCAAMKTWTTLRKRLIKTKSRIGTGKPIWVRAQRNITKLSKMHPSRWKKTRL
ncbi:hypothetical protein ERJ75_000587400 [Trypanosoma vivax]|nr:hypothetical protein ERJ75_000587400 [Trypanosoma vivax]